jgi:hypothetical protein
VRFTWVFTNPVDTETLSHLVADRIWPTKGRNFGECRGIAVMDGETLAAGLIYHNYDPDSQVIEISGAAWVKGWLTRDVLRAMYGYPFIDCGCQAVVQRVSDDDEAQHRMLASYGSVRYRIPRLRGENAAENIFVTTKEAWASNKFNRKHEVN